MNEDGKPEKSNVWRSRLSVALICGACQLFSLFVALLTIDQIHSWRPNSGVIKQLFYLLDNPIPAFTAATYLAISFAKLFRPKLPPPWEYTLVAMLPALVAVPFIIFSVLAISGVMLFAVIAIAFLLSAPLLTTFASLRKGNALRKWQFGTSAIAALILLLHFIPIQNYYLSMLDTNSRDEIAISWFGEPYVQAKKALLECSDLKEKVGQISTLVASGQGPFTNDTNVERYGGYYLDYVSDQGKGNIITNISPSVDGWSLNIGRVDLNQEQFIFVECK